MSILIDKFINRGNISYYYYERMIFAAMIVTRSSFHKNMRHLASQFQLACLQLRHRVEEVFALLKTDFVAVRATHRTALALPIHLLDCLLAYSLHKSLIA